LQQQFADCTPPGRSTGTLILQVSAGFTYSYDSTQLLCADRIYNLALNGVPINPATTYKDNEQFPADGGDSFPALAADQPGTRPRSTSTPLRLTSTPELPECRRGRRIDHEGRLRAPEKPCP
jgi:hypothetical protein